MLVKANNYYNKKDILQLILDESRLYVDESLGSVMVRGEVVVHFARDTPIQGPIELVFEGTQRYQTWPEITGHAISGTPIDSKIQVIELSILPPNSKGIMPAGIQRFPFEFPIPASLPNTIHIANRLDISYRLTATLKRSAYTDIQHESINWIDWARHSTSKKKYSAIAPIRIVRVMKSTTSPIGGDIHLPTLTATSPISDVTSPAAANLSFNGSQATLNDSIISLPWNRRGLEEFSTMDEQHDQLAYSFSGRTSCNLDQPLEKLQQGIRYNIGVDRTAFALGTRIGLDLMIEPTVDDATVKSVYLKITEARKYAIDIPKDRTSNVAETRRGTETVNMILKWAYGQAKCSKYVQHRSSSKQLMAYFDSPHRSDSSLKSFISETKPLPCDFLEEADELLSENKLNLKELNQQVKVGESFRGRFMLQVPECLNLLHPSMEYDSISVYHWMHLVVVMECNGHEFEIDLETPARILDCRVVSVDDDTQMILPPPPSYKEDANRNSWFNASSFWEQREAITAASSWGSMVPCPCRYKKTQVPTEDPDTAPPQYTL